jgi:repressor LexA
MQMGRYFNKDKFSKRLLELMVDNNDTTYSLGEYLHLSNASISRYTTGRMAPKVPTVQAIAEKYGVNPAWLMGPVANHVGHILRTAIPGVFLPCSMALMYP